MDQPEGNDVQAELLERESLERLQQQYPGLLRPRAQKPPAEPPAELEWDRKERAWRVAEDHRVQRRWRIVRRVLALVVVGIIWGGMVYATYGLVVAALAKTTH